jgi:hypothetical protein
MFSRELALCASGWALLLCRILFGLGYAILGGGGKNPVFCYICALNLNHKE